MSEATALPTEPQPLPKLVPTKQQIFCHEHWRAHFGTILGKTEQERSPNTDGRKMNQIVQEITANFGKKYK